jgi:hypothetical protein
VAPPVIVPVTLNRCQEVVSVTAVGLPVFHLPRVLEQVCGFAFELELRLGSGPGLVAVNAELQIAHDGRPRLDDRLTGPDAQKLDLTEPERPNHFEQRALGWCQVPGAGGSSVAHRATSAVASPPDGRRLSHSWTSEGA